VGSAAALAVALVSRVVIVMVDFAPAGAWSVAGSCGAPDPGSAGPVAGPNGTDR
jgi:hypothetical protein